MLASMRGRLTLLFALSIALFTALLCESVVTYSRRLEATQLAQALETHAEGYRRDLRDEKRQPRNSSDWQAFLEQENSTLRDYSLSMVVLNTNGDVVARSHRDGVTWPFSGDWLVETIPVRDYTLILAARWHSTRREISQLAINLTLVTIGVIVATALGSWMLVGRVLSPIDRLSRQAQEASAEDWRVRLDVPSRDVEVVGLVDTLNGLLDRLARTVESRGRFYAAASHELRTPIQGLSALLEVGLSRPRDAEQWREIASQALDESRRLSTLTQDLLVLNQLENQTTAPPRSELDAADIIERIVAQLKSVSTMRQLKVTVDLPDEADISAPANHLEMLFRNLIENSFKYARVGGDVEILLLHQGGAMLFSVWNSADLPPDFEADKLFEPFFRLDAARQSQTGGNGLGLSLVASLCHANGWKARLKPENHGMLALVELPDSPV